MRDDLTLRVDVKRAVARESDAAGRLHCEKSGAIDSEVGVVACGLQISLAQVDERATEDAEVVDGAIEGRQTADLLDWL